LCGQLYGVALSASWCGSSEAAMSAVLGLCSSEAVAVGALAGRSCEAVRL
jgi:hypothetical protein